MNREDVFLFIISLDVMEPILGFFFSVKHTMKSTRSPRGNKRELGVTRIKTARGTGHQSGDAALKEMKTVGIPASGRKTRKDHYSFLVPTSQAKWARISLANAGYTVIGDEDNPSRIAPLIQKWRDRPQGRQRRKRRR